MTDHDLHDLLHDHVADVATPDLSPAAWRRGRALRRQRSAAVIGAGALTAAAVVGAVGILQRPTTSTPPTAASASPSPGVSVTAGISVVAPYVDRGAAPDRVVGGIPVYDSPLAGQEQGLDRADDVPLPADLDLSQPAPAAGDEPIERAEAAVLLLDADGTRTLRLIAGDGSQRDLDLTPAGSFTPTPAMLSPLGDRLAFPTRGSVAVYEIDRDRWVRIDTGDLPTQNLTWQGDDLLLYPEPYVGPGTVCTVETRGCGDHSNPFPTVRLPDGAKPYGRSRVGPFGETLAYTEGDGSTAIQVGDDPGARLVMAGKDRATDCCGVLTWASRERLVYQSADGSALRLLAWKVGTHRFELVTDLTGIRADTDALVSLPRWDLG